MQTTVKERIICFIEFKKISVRGFEARCGLSNGYLRQLRNSPTADKVEMILSAFPELRREWLMTGEGEMLKESVTNVGEVSGNGNMIGTTTNQTIGENCGQNAGRDINNYGEKEFMAEIISQRQHAARQLDQIDRLIQRIDRLTSLLEAMQQK